MAFAAVLPLLGTLATVAGTAISVMGQIAQGKAAAAQGAQRREVARAQAIDAQNAGKAAFAQNQIKQRQRQQDLRFALARQEAVDAGGGFDPGGIGAQARKEGLFRQGTLFALQQGDVGAVERARHERRADFITLEGDAAFQAGQIQQSAFNTGAASTLVGGFGSVVGQFNAQSNQNRQIAALQGSQGGGGGGSGFTSIFDPSVNTQSSISFG